MAQLGALISFTAGTPAVANDVNYNFNLIRTFINSANFGVDNINGTLSSRSGAPILTLEQVSEPFSPLYIINAQSKHAINVWQQASLDANQGVILINDTITQSDSTTAALLMTLASGSTNPAMLIKHGPAVETLRLTKDALSLFTNNAAGTISLFAGAIELSQTRVKLPLRTTVQRDAVSQEGSIVYNTDTDQINVRRSDSWSPVDVPVGSMQVYAGAVAPEGWLLCGDVTLDSVANPQYAKLFAVIGTTYGGTGASSFKLPDTRGRTIIGVGTGVGLTARALAATGGAETHLLTTNESGQKAVTTSSPSISLTKDQDGEEGGNGSQKLITGPGGEPQGTLNWNHTHTIAGESAAQAHNNMQPFLALNYIIKY